MAHEHTFTEIAMENTEEEDPKTWSWCIRCGVLKLGPEIFTPGPTQTEVLTADE